MTDPRWQPVPEPPPRVEVPASLRTAAGSPAQVEVLVTNTAEHPRVLSVAALGADPSWLPEPVRTEVLPPGGQTTVTLTLTPAVGTYPAHYPLAITAQALEPETGTQVGGQAGLAETTLVVNPRALVSMELSPTEATVVASTSVSVVLRNSGHQPARVTLASHSSRNVSIRLRRTHVDVPAGGEIRVKGRAQVRRPRMFGMRNRHTYTLTASGTESVRHVEGAVTQRTIIGPWGLKALALVSVMALWITLAMVFIPRLADQFRPGDPRGTTISGQGDAGPGSDGGSGGSGGGAEGGAGGDGGDGADGGDGGTQSVVTRKKASAVQLSGTITSEEPEGVTVTLRPTSLVDEEAQGGTPIGLAAATFGAGKSPMQAFLLPSATSSAAERSASTTSDGTWSFPRVSAPGYYLLTFSKLGYQTQRFVLDSTNEAAQEPLEVDLEPGDGRLSGRITRADGGAVGGAEITITDGTNTITTSSNSGGRVGTWQVEGLATPGDYVVSAHASGLSQESARVRLPAGAVRTVDLRLKPGVASLEGTVSRALPSGSTKGLGGIRITVTDGADVNRSSTTVSQKGRKFLGHYNVPGLPVPGTYTVTISGDGYLAQTLKVRFRPGASSQQRDAQLAPSTGVLAGLVFSRDTSTTPPGGRQPRSGAGMVLSNETDTYKTTSTNNGRYNFTGVAPGTYSLATRLFEYGTSFLTVEVKAGKRNPEDVDVKLSVVDGGLPPDTARIRGSVIDAATGLEVRCPTGVECLTAQVTDTVPDEDEPNDPSKDVLKEYTTTFAPDETYLVPEDEDDGLRPGLHTVRVTAPHYEAATVKVETPEGDTVTAPTAELYPAPKIQGTIFSGAGVPGADTCVWAVRGPLTATPDPPLPACGTPESDDVCAPTPPAPPYDPLTPPSRICGFVADPGLGNFVIEVPEHGTWSVYVDSASQEYVDPSPTQVVLGLGETTNRSAVLNRLGRINLLALTPDTSGYLVPAVEATVNVTGDPPDDRSTETDVNGRLLITSLRPSTTYVITGQDTTNPALTGTSSPLSVSLNQTLDLTLPLTDPIAWVVGRVTSNFDGALQDVSGARVNITGTTDYIGNAPAYGTREVTTDANGCFALDSKVAAPDIDDCTGVIDPARTTMELLSNNLRTVRLEASGYVTRVLADHEVSTSAVNSFPLEPRPVGFTGTIETNPTLAVDWSAATFQVTSLSGGTETISISTSGTSSNTNLTWNDSRYPTSNQIRPGTYTVTAFVPGYSPGVGTFTCAIGVPCSPPALVVSQLGDLTISTVNPGGDVDHAEFVLRKGGNEVQTKRAGEADNSVTFNGLVPGATDYSVRIKAAGHIFATTGATHAPVDCSAGSVTLPITAGALTTCTATLTPRAAITGTVKGILAKSPATSPTRDLGGATVTVRRCGNAACDTYVTDQTFTGTTEVDGDYSISGSTAVEGLLPGRWKVSTHPAGYAPTDTIVTIPDVDPPTDVTAHLRPYVVLATFTVTLKDANDQNVSGANLALIQGGTSIADVDPAPGGGSYRFDNVVPGGYTLQASGPGLITSTVQVTIVEGNPSQTFTMRIGRGANTAQGTITSDGIPSAPIQGAAVTLCATSGPAPCSTTGDSGTNGSPMRVLTDTNGRFELRTVPDGDYRVTIRAYGHETRTVGPFTFDHRLSPVGPVNETLTSRRRTVTVTVDNPATTSDALDGSVVSLVARSGDGNADQTPASQVTNPNGSETFTFNAVRFGCYRATLALPANHYGTTALTPPATVPQLTCSSPHSFTVTGADNNDPTSGSFAVAEGRLTITTTATAQPGAGRPAPTTADVVVNPGGTPTHTADGTPIGTPVEVWLAPGGYAVRATPTGPGWTPFWAPKTVNGTMTAGADQSAGPALTEATGRLVASVTGASAGTEAQLTVTAGPGQTADLPPAYAGTLTTTDGAFTFDLPSGNWVIAAALPPAAANDNPVTIDQLDDTATLTP
ncbi:carboxypeptidase regulatory-like domain-containing protein [Nocardioides sp.]|uniref:carboxypeptidase regulatory-like domain-containing protein n=1 Tax=Nocardioides sp. TaxID=35761 RepID=UPI00356A72EB